MREAEICAHSSDSTDDSIAELRRKEGIAQGWSGVLADGDLMYR